MSTHRPVLASEMPIITPPAIDPRGSRRVALALVVIACLPIVVATVRALLHHWTPVGDDGLLALRAQDVFSRHTPLLGTASSASFAATKPLSNAGPLYFDLLSVPVWALGSAVGTAIGVAIVNIGAVATIGWAAWRRAGVLGTALGMLVAATLAWSMGSELLFDVWQPHSLLLPFLAFLFFVWSLAAADFVVAPVAVFVGSLLMQTHLTYGFLTPALLVVGLVVGWVRSRRTRAGGDDEEGRATFWIVSAIGVGLLAWTQPVIEQLTTSDGNMSRLIRQIQHPPKALVGARGALRITATAFARSPFWLRDSFGDTFRPPGAPYGTTSATLDGAHVVSITFAIVALAAIVLLLFGAGVAARRRADTTVVSAVVVAGAALAVGWYTASKVSTDVVGIAPHQFRFLWPLGAFLAFVGLLAVCRVTRLRRYRLTVLGVVVLGVVIMSAWNLPTYAATTGPQLDESLIPVERAIDRQMGAAGRSQPVLLEWSRLTFGEPFSGGLMAELRRRGIEVVTTDAYLARQLGPTRLSKSHDARVKIFYRLGDAARSPRLGPFDRVAYHDGLDAGQREDMAKLRRALGGFLVSHGLRRTAKLQNGIDIGLWTALRGPFTPEAVGAAFDTRALAGAMEAGALDVPAAWRGRFAEYARLQTRSDRRTIGVYVGPVSAPAP